MDANMHWPGPGNNSFNEFAINRTYLDFKFTPNDDLSMRITPDMYAMVNTGTTCTAASTSTSDGGIKTTTTTKCTASSGDKVGANTGYAQTDDGNFQLEVELTAKAPGVDQVQLEELVKTAHTVCPYSNALKGSVPVKLSVT